MRIQTLAIVALLTPLLSAAPPADAKGCVKGAVIGGAAGHVAGHHGVVGAAAGCAIGHHRAKKAEKEAQQQQQANGTDAATGKAGDRSTAANSTPTGTQRTTP